MTTSRMDLVPNSFLGFNFVRQIARRLASFLNHISLAETFFRQTAHCAPVPPTIKMEPPLEEWVWDGIEPLRCFAILYPGSLDPDGDDTTAAKGPRSPEDGNFHLPPAFRTRRQHREEVVTSNAKKLFATPN